jgi:hypothetical protein
MHILAWCMEHSHSMGKGRDTNLRISRNEQRAWCWLSSCLETSGKEMHYWRIDFVFFFFFFFALFLGGIMRGGTLPNNFTSCPVPQPQGKGFLFPDLHSFIHSTSRYRSPRRILLPFLESNDLVNKAPFFCLGILGIRQTAADILETRLCLHFRLDE